MKQEKSCGAVVFTRVAGAIRYVLIRQTNGIYGFPKGHMEPGETEEQTALREIREEVGLRPRLLEGFRMEEVYGLPGLRHRKRVVYFLAEYADQTIRIQQEELTNAGLVSFEEAMQLLDFKRKRDILTAARAFLTP